ncbi:MAG: VTT domain-containing protein [Eubacteriales bacterium]
MQLLKLLIDFILHSNDFITEWIKEYGTWIFGLIFVIIFCETGLVFLPLLPGDSVIFAVGAIAASNPKLNVWAWFIILIIAAVLGDTVNYEIGKRFGRRIIEYKRIRLVKPENLAKADAFVAKHGGKAIFLARFMPIIRTIVPFVIGVGKLEYKKFLTYNALGGVVWVSLFLGMGYFFGNLDFVKNNFSLILLAIIFISVLPVMFSVAKSLLAKLGKKKK